MWADRDGNRCQNDGLEPRRVSSTVVFVAGILLGRRTRPAPAVACSQSPLVRSHLCAALRYLKLGCDQKDRDSRFCAQRLELEGVGRSRLSN